MNPSSAAASARFKLVFVASFGLITGACAFIGYYIVRRYRKSSDLNTQGCLSDDKTPNDKEEDIGRLKNAEIVSNDAVKESRENEEHEAEVDGRDLDPDNKDIDTKYQDSVAESNKLDASLTGIERDARRDVTSSSDTSNENDAQSRGVERSINGDTLPGKRKVFSAGITHFLDETNGDLSSSDFAKGTHQSQKQDSWSETVIVDSGKESDQTVRTEEDIEAGEQGKLNAGIQVAPHKEAPNEKVQFPNLNDDSNNYGTNDRQNGESKISEVENFSGDQFAKSGKIFKSGDAAAAAASSTQESTSQDDVNKDNGDRSKRLTTGINVTSTTKSALPLPLTPPPPSDGGTSRRQRGGRGGQTTSKQTRGAGSQNALSGRRRWSPLEDKTTAENVELDAGSQQASWTSNRPSSSSGGAQSGARSPWTVGAGVAEEAAIAPADPAGKVEFDDNFVVDAVARKGFGDVSSASPAERLSQQPSVARRSSGRGPAKDIGCLVEAPSECVLERKPLISENEEDDDDEEDGHLFADHQRTKNTEEETEETMENVAAAHELSISTTEERKKLVHIDENCVDSLIQLLAKEAAEDTAFRLASLRALVNLSWTTEKHSAYITVIDQLFSTVDSQDARLRLESLRVLANLSKNPEMVSYLLAAKAPGCLLKMLTPELDEEVLTLWLGVLDDILWTSKELCLTYASLPSDRRAASPETVYTGLYGLKNSRVLKSRIFILSRHRSQRVTYLASHIYSCLTS